MASRSRRWCRRSCGPRKPHTDRTGRCAAAGATLIDLVPVDGPLGQKGGAAPGREGRNMDHFCLTVEPFDADAIIAHLREHGAEPAPLASRYGAEGQGPSIYVPDPEGNVVE